MKRCVIITAYNSYPIRDAMSIREDDFIICADGGYLLAQKEGIRPDVVIGDSDSYSGTVKASEVIHVPVEKDDTDTLICLKYSLKKGFRDIILAGGIGGRLDHTVSNLQTMAYALDHGARIQMADAYNHVWMIEGGSLSFKKQVGVKLSVFAFSEKCTGVTLRGVQYPLTDFTLQNNFPLGVSNEFETDAVVQNKTGKMVVMLCREK